MQPVVGRTQEFQYPDALRQDHWALSGAWKQTPERITAEGRGAKLKLHFKSAKVFVVLGSKDGTSLDATLTLNGVSLGAVAGADAPNGTVTVKGHTLFELVNQSTVQAGVLEISAPPGLEAYAFTFGD